MSITIAPEKAAIDAATVAFDIASSFETSETLAFRAEKFLDVHASVRAALAARGAIGSEYTVVELGAEYGIRGSHLDDAPRIEPTNGLMAAVVSVRSKFEINDLTLISVLGSLDHEIDGLTDENEIFFSLLIYIIEAPEKEQEPNHG